MGSQPSGPPVNPFPKTNQPVDAAQTAPVPAPETEAGDDSDSE
jgi:hypothetical protein